VPYDLLNATLILKKQYLKPLQSVSINLSYRITLELLVKDERIILINIGEHNAVY